MGFKSHNIFLGGLKMSIKRYLILKKWDSDLESFVEVFGDMDKDSMNIFATDAYLQTKLTSLQDFHPDNSFKAHFNDDDYAKFFNTVELVMHRELTAEKNAIGISDEFDSF